MDESKALTRQEELKLVKKMKAGSRQAFGILYERYVERIYTFIYHKTFHAETARDLTQNVFIKCLSALDKFESDQGSFAAWLFTVARNAVIDHYRTRHTSISLEDVWDLAADADVAMDAQNRERHQILHEQLHRLKPEQRELLILRIWQDLGFAEIAEIMGGSTGSCKMAFHRLIKRLREEMPALLMMLLILKN